MESVEALRPARCQPPTNRRTGLSNRRAREAVAAVPATACGEKRASSFQLSSGCNCSEAASCRFCIVFFLHLRSRQSAPVACGGATGESNQGPIANHRIEILHISHPREAPTIWSPRTHRARSCCDCYAIWWSNLIDRGLRGDALIGRRSRRAAQLKDVYASARAMER